VKNRRQGVERGKYGMLISNCNSSFGGSYFVPKVDSVCNTGKKGSEFGNQKGKKKKRRSEFDVMLEKEIEKNESNVR
jgi:hypothetical protein